MRILGPPIEDIWGKIAEEFSGRYISGGWIEQPRVEVPHRNWTILLDRYVVSTGKSVIVYTRFRAPFKNPSGFHMRIRTKGVMSKLKAAFGHHRRDIGSSVDETLSITGDNTTYLSRLVLNPRIRSLIKAQRSIDLSIKDDEGPFQPDLATGESELYLRINGTVKDVNKLRSIIELFMELLDEMEAMGITTDEAPATKL